MPLTEDGQTQDDVHHPQTVPSSLKGQGIQSLHFPTPSGRQNVPVEDTTYPCLFCDLQFSVEGQEECLRHLLLQHKFVIADVKLVADFPKYARYWKERFQQGPAEEFCSVIKTNSKEGDIEPSDYYYLLCDLLPEDKELREQLQRNRLEMVLERNRCEREDQTFTRVCLFCSERFFGKRHQIFRHMLEDHKFNVGRPDNIVFGSELLDTLEDKLKRLQCLYCEKTFKSWETLREHMRKKWHKKINPKNSNYDRFFVINYLELGKNWESLNAEEDTEDNSPNENDEWSDWKEEEESLGAVCLFCDFASTSFETMCQHMTNDHAFNLAEIKSQMKLNFYQQVKLINYIRREVFQKKCYNCKKTYSNSQELSYHLTNSGHIMQLPDTTEWDQPQFFFSTYENDNLLCIIDDDDDEEEEVGNSLGVTVHPEDIISRDNSVLSEEVQRTCSIKSSIFNMTG